MVDQVAFAMVAADRCIAGSPSRRPGNFLLRGQKKVTKEEALNRTRAPHAQAAPCNSRRVSGQTRAAALSLLSLSPASVIAASARLTRGCTPCSREQPKTASLGRRDRCAASTGASPQRRSICIPGEPGVQPALTGVKGRWMVLFTGTAARAKRFASARNASGCFRAPLMAASRSCAVQGLFFGDFLLAPQKKVTPPPGGTPGTLPVDKRHLDKPATGKADPTH
jgi:hypothetical protein